MTTTIEAPPKAKPRDGCTIASEMARKYPAALDTKSPKPLKVGISADIAADGAFTAIEITKGLACYANSPKYLRAMVVNAPRVDLHGTPVDVVSETAAAFAKEKLSKLEARKMAKQASPPPKPKLQPPKKTMVAPSVTLTRETTQRRSASTAPSQPRLTSASKLCLVVLTSSFLPVAVAKVGRHGATKSFRQNSLKRRNDTRG